MWTSPEEIPPGLLVFVSNLMRQGGSPGYTPIPLHICPTQPPPPAPQNPNLVDAIDDFYNEPSVEKILRQADEKRKEVEEKERLKAEQETAKAEALERKKRALEDGVQGAEGGEGEKPVVGVGARSGVSYCTPRKVVSKISNQIVGLKQVQDDDDDVADVFKL